jgi:hypothetical protein
MESGWHWTCNEQKWSRSPNRIDGSFDRQSRLGENKYRRTSATTFLRCGAFAVYSTYAVRSCAIRWFVPDSAFPLAFIEKTQQACDCRIASNMNRHTKRPPPKGPHAGDDVRGVPGVSSTKARTTVTTSIRRRSPHRCLFGSDLQCLRDHINIFQPGAGVEEHDFVRWFQETFAQQSLIRRQAGGPFRRSKQPFFAGPFLHSA